MFVNGTHFVGLQNFAEILHQISPLIVGSILMAFSYRFTFRAMMRIFVVVIVGLYALVALLSRLPFDWQGLLQGVADFMSVWWRAALIAVVLCVGVYCISAALAIRFYRAKEL